MVLKLKKKKRCKKNDDETFLFSVTRSDQAKKQQSSKYTMYVHRDISGVKIPYFKSWRTPIDTSILYSIARSLYQRCPLFSMLCALCSVFCVDDYMQGIRYQTIINNSMLYYCCCLLCVMQLITCFCCRLLYCCYCTVKVLVYKTTDFLLLNILQ